MKKIYTLLLLLVLTNGAFSQVLEYQFPGDFGRIYQVSDNEYVYGILYDSIRQFNVYSLDHQLLSTFTMPPDTMYYGFIHLSKTLFNNDPKFELLYSWQDMNPYTSFGVRVINEDGVVLLEAPGFWGVGLYNTNSGAKMMLSYPYGPHQVNVYSLSGTVLELDEAGKSLDSRLFPNPSGGQVNIAFQAPGNESGLVLSVYSTKGEIVNQRNLGPGANNILLDVTGLPAGVYLYRIHNETFTTLTKKFVVTKTE